ncbi:hypothetical protein RHGRI_029160 [Rhododendron griersonianum]|uniref:Uncharacterized protein n=1 Tax=Rhododendron griersonianum TaxID=479676 RepID=A0AAV6IIK4_9ERIC|nr:hypothetical protein RHGRI_029160 [Rhododendron griersonianum]
MVTPEKLFSLLLGPNPKDGVEVDEAALSQLKGCQTIGAGKPSAPKLKIDKNVLTQVIQAGASAVANSLGKRKRKADHAGGPMTNVASEVPIGSIGRTLSRTLSPSIGHANPVKIEEVKSKGPAETISDQEARDIGPKKKVGFQSLGQSSSSEIDPSNWLQQDWVDMSRLIYPGGSEFP